ncbi:MAG: dihydrolipoyl dehydrogenase family protein [Planctomycetota bacterium]|jgi:dihydrolipoamide dehydrogenase
MRDFDLIVLGAGNSADVYRAADAAGLRTAVVEKGPLGGTCPNRGCIPSKLLLAHADRADAIRSSGRFHIDSHIDAIDGDAILRDVREYTDRWDTVLEESLGSSVTLFRGHGRFVDGRTIEVAGDRITADRIVIATGSRPRRLDLGVPYWTSDDVFRLESMPDSIVFVGGGFISAELAHFFAGLGVPTTILAREDRLLGKEDEETATVFCKAFGQRVDVRYDIVLERAEHDGTRYTLYLSDGTTLETHALVLAIGRVPNSDDLGLEHTSIHTSGEGFIETDAFLRTSAPGVHALGDVAGKHFFTHTASFEAMYLGRLLTGTTDERLDYGPVPHAVFTDPELAGVGRTERELQRAGVDYVKATLPFASVTKGRAIKEEHGLAKLLVARDGSILGAHIVGAHASILLHEIVAVMKWRNDIRSLTDMIHVHPSLPEVIGGVASRAMAALRAAR